MGAGINRPIGFSGEQTSSARDYLLTRVWFHTISVVIDSSARDGGNNPNTTMRKGFALGRVTATGRWMQYDDTGGDGRETARVVLDEEVNLLNDAGSAENKDAVATVWGYADQDLIFGGGSGAAIDAAGRTDLTTATNGCLFILKSY